MAHTHEFDCKVCGAHLDSRQELDQHNRQTHPDQTRQAGSSGSGIGKSGSPPSSSNDRS